MNTNKGTILMEKERIDALKKDLDKVAQKYGLNHYKEVDQVYYIANEETAFTDDLIKVIMEEAQSAGVAAYNHCFPTPMTVHSELPGSKTKDYHVADGVCGFAWIRVRASTPQNRKFINSCRKAGVLGDTHGCSGPGYPSYAWTKAYNGGYEYWVHYGGQSMQRKEDYAEAFAKALNKYGVEAYAESRLD